MKIRVNHLIIYALLLSNALTFVLLLREKVIAGLAEQALYQAHTKVSALSNKLHISLYKLKEHNTLAIKNWSQVHETRNYSIPKTDAELLDQCGEHVGRLSGGYNLLKRNLWTARRELSRLQKQHREINQGTQSSMGLKLSPQYDNQKIPSPVHDATVL